MKHYTMYHLKYRFKDQTGEMVESSTNICTSNVIYDEQKQFKQYFVSLLKELKKRGKKEDYLKQIADTWELIKAKELCSGFCFDGDVREPVNTQYTHNT